VRTATRGAAMPNLRLSALIISMGAARHDANPLIREIQT
jgi:hypothetical protein